MGLKVLIKDGLVTVSDSADRAHAIELADVESFIPYRKVPAAKRRDDLLIGMSIGAVAGSQVSTDGKLINPAGLAAGAVAGAVIGAPLWLRESKAQDKIINMYNEDVVDKTKVGS